MKTNGSYCTVYQILRSKLAWTRHEVLIKTVASAWIR